jgi:hypothetical protein
MNFSKFFALMFVVFIACLTITYFVINKNVMDEEYRMMLAAFSLINITLLGALVLDLPKINWLVVFFIMIIGAFCKALLQRNIPGGHLDDFIFVKFDQTWTYPVKVAWHVSIDWFVLLVTILIKNTHRLFR